MLTHERRRSLRSTSLISLTKEKVNNASCACIVHCSRVRRRLRLRLCVSKFLICAIYDGSRCTQYDHPWPGGRSSFYRTPTGRVIERSEYTEAVEANSRRIRKHAEIYSARQQIIEHVFGTIKRSRCTAGGIRSYTTQRAPKKRRIAFAQGFSDQRSSD